MANEKITAQEKKWRAESDAQALISAVEIEADKERLAAAKGAMPKLQQEAQKRAAAVAKVSARYEKSPELKK